jgi:hypothetical protein
MRNRRIESSLALLAALVVLIGVGSAAGTAFGTRGNQTLNYGLTTPLQR